MMHSVCKGIVRTVEELRRVQPDAVMVHVEAIGCGITQEPALRGGNLVRTPAGAALLDFEASCLGPREWDLSAVSEEAATVAGILDPALLSLLRSLRSLCVCVWCWAQAGRTVEIDEAARYHLSRLRAER